MFDRFILWILFLLPGVLIAQEADSIYRKQSILERMDSVSNWKIEHGRSTLTPFLAPSYTPETSVMLTAGGLYTFMMKRKDKFL